MSDNYEENDDSDDKSDHEKLTIQDVKLFLEDAKKKRENYLNIGDASWREIKRLNRKGQMVGNAEAGRRRNKTRFPLWWSSWKIRQPIVLARLPIPVLKDTQGDDPYGRTACVIGERLIRNILTTFDALSEFQSGVDDFLITNFGYGRAFYRKTELMIEEKIRVQEIEQPEAAPQEPMLDEQGQPMPQEPLPPPQPIFVNEQGEQVDPSTVQQDDLGLYVSTGAEVEIDNEEVYFEAGLYSTMLVDADIRKWSAVTRVAFETPYTYREFCRKFGKEAFEKLSISNAEDYRRGTPIIVIEYHDKFLKEVRWLAEDSEDFFQPLEIAEMNEVDEVDNGDLYGLSDFFPCPEPLLMNAATDEFWPTPEFFQVGDLIEDVHSIASRMVLLTKAIRARFLFDSSIPELTQLISEVDEGGGLGVPNLENALMNNNGKLSNLVAYFPVGELIEALQNIYTAFEQRLNMYYQITGISDLIRGQSNSDVQKTYGERQMEGKYALNRIEPFQQRTQDWIKSSFQVLMEMALKLFSDRSLDEYITVQTLDPEDKERYQVALDILRDNKRRRFRVEFETDSTIAINEEWRKKQATELVNTLTKAMEATAKTAETQPELAGTELIVLKHLIGEFADGKLFIDEIQDSIEQVIQKVNQPKPEEPNIELEKLKLEQQRLQMDGQRLQMDSQKFGATQQLEQLKIQAGQQVDMAKLQQADRISNIEAQLEQYKISGDQQIEQFKVQATSERDRAELEKEYQKISAEITLAQQEISLKRDELMVEIKKVTDKKELDEIGLIVDQRVTAFEQQLESARLELEASTKMLMEKEKLMTEQRLQSEHNMQKNTTQLEAMSQLLDVALKKKELDTPIEIKEPSGPKKTTKKRD